MCILLLCGLYLTFNNYGKIASYLFDIKGGTNVTYTIEREFNLIFPDLYFDLSDIILFSFIVLGIYYVSKSSISTKIKIILCTTLMLLPFILVFPVLHLYNVILGFFTWNCPIGIDKTKYFPESTIFENKQNFQLIKKEVINLLETEKLNCFSNYHVTDLDNDDQEKCWKWFPLYDQKGWYKENCNKLPYITQILRNLKTQIASASISILEPETKILPHRGYAKSLLRYHLGIIIPPNNSPYITVDGIKYYWKEGEGIMFDDMFTHYVKNPSKYRRVVLFIDVVRNDIPPILNVIHKYGTKFLVNSGYVANYDKTQHEQKNIK